MNQKDQALTAKAIAKVFEKHGAPFLTLKKFQNLLDDGDRQYLGLKKSSKQDDIKSALSPLPPPRQFVKYRGSVYLLGGAPEDVALDYVRAKKSLTFKQLNAYFPMAKAPFRDLVNQLLDEGSIKVRLGNSDLPILYCAEKRPEAPSSEPVKAKTSPETSKGKAAEDEKVLSEIELFKRAYDAAGKGANYVFIHEIRKLLAWSRERFDKLLYRLMTDGYVAAHPGNPGTLNADEVKNSFEDEFGDLYITVTWRKPV